jgi:hypothetical protein
LIDSLGDVRPGKYKMMDTASGSFTSENRVYQEWLLGFVSGFNRARATDPDQQVRNIDPAAMDLWMRNWCNKHPTSTVFEAASAFIDEMRSKALAEQR